jgi:hypothetical protein
MRYTHLRAGVYDARSAGVPVMLSATLEEDGITLTFVFDRAVTGGGSYTLTPFGIGDIPATYASGNGSATLLYGIDPSWVGLLAGRPCTLSYTGPGTTSAVGGQLANFSGFPVTNNAL